MKRTPTYRSRPLKAGIVVIGALILLTAIIALADRPARPPKPAGLVGTWIGFDEDGLEFTRLDLRPDFTGYCARVSPSYSSLHDYGVQVYRVTHWTTDGWKFSIDLSTIDAIDTPLFIKGRIEMEALKLEVSAGTNGWTRKLELQKESWIDEANQETKKKIMEVEHK
jgi:hypothetical protein